MGTFGQDLRAARLKRGIKLEEISAITKISQRHLVALEQEQFKLLPGGILGKGILRGYVNAAGLDEHDWLERFVQANASALEDEQNWAAFATNVGRVRLERREATAQRMRWVGAMLLVLVAGAAVFMTVRYYGLRAGWWDSLLPMHSVAAKSHGMFVHFLGLIQF